MSYGNAKNVYVRLSVQDADKAAQALRAFGSDGKGALKKIETASKPASRGLLALDRSVGKAAKSIKLMAGSALALAGPAVLVALGKRALTTADAIAKVSDSIGISTTSLQQYRHAANLAGVEQGTLDQSFRQFSKRVGEARQGTGALSEFLVKYDKNLLKAIQSSKNNNEALDLTFAAMARVKDQADRGALANAVFGRSGIAMTNMVKDGVQGLDKALQEAADLGMIIPDDLLRNAEAANDQLTRVWSVMDAKLSVALLQVTPMIVSLADAFLGAATSAGILWDKAFREPAKWGMATIQDEIRELNGELKELQDLQKGAYVVVEMGGVETKVKANGAELDRQGVDIAEKQSRLAELEARANDLKTRVQNIGAGSAGSLTLSVGTDTDGKAFKNVLKVTQGWAKKRTAERKRQDAALAKAKERAGAELAKVEGRWNKASLSSIAYLHIQKKKELDKFTKYRMAGLITEEQKADAHARIMSNYARKEADERQKLHEKTFGGAAQKEVDAYFDGINNAGQRAGRFTVGVFSSLSDELTDFFSKGKFSFSDFLGSIKVGLARLAAEDVIGAIGGAIGIGGSSGGSALGGIVSGAVDWLGGLFGFRDGGKVRGPGTTTSDSIPALLSDKEFVVNARAAEKHGPLLERINNDGLFGFARGGRVGATGRTGFAYGGNVGGLDMADNSLDAPGQTGGYDGGVGNNDYEWAAYHGPGGAWQPDGRGMKDYEFEAFFRDNRKPIYDKKGNIVDFHGGGFWDRIKTFLGVGTKDGFLGSAGAGFLTNILTAPVGGWAARGLGALINLAREGLTDGRAVETGVAGLAYDLWSGEQTPGGWAKDVSARFDGLRAAAAGPRAALGGLGSGVGVGGSGDNLISPAVNRGFTMTAAERARGYGATTAAGLDGLGARWTRDFLPVRQASANIISGLAGGGHVEPGQEYVVGEFEAERFRTDRPGQIIPGPTPIATPDNSDVVEALGAVIDGLRDLKVEVARSHRQIAALAGSGGAWRQTSRG